MIKIGFLIPSIGNRGTDKAIYDYAYYNQKILNNKSIILTENENKNTEFSNIILNNNLQKLKNNFDLLYINNNNELEDVVNTNEINIIYFLYGGEKTKYNPRNCKFCYHCVFNFSEPHGDVYASISEFLKYKHVNTYGIKYLNIPIVPHICNFDNIHTDNYRKEYNISDDDIVFGRIGGKDTLNIGFVFSVIIEIVSNYKNIYFIFVNTNKFYEHKQIIYIDSISIYDEYSKLKFINTCDAHFHARHGGETFGLACAEFSLMNKPSISFYLNEDDMVNKCVQDKEHLLILEDQIILYKNYLELYSILVNFNKNEINKKNWNNYSKYTPEYVMSIFKNVFID